jgi:hypothetical protein
VCSVSSIAVPFLRSSLSCLARSTAACEICQKSFVSEVFEMQPYMTERFQTFRLFAQSVGSGRLMSNQLLIDASSSNVLLPYLLKCKCKS